MSHQIILFITFHIMLQADSQQKTRNKYKLDVKVTKETAIKYGTKGKLAFA